MLTVLCKSYAAENAPDCGCVSCVLQRETVYGLHGRIRVRTQVGAILNVLV